MTNAVVVVDCTIRAMGGDVQTEGAVGGVVGRTFTTLSHPSFSFCALGADRSDSGLTSDRAKAVEKCNAGRNVLEEFRDIVLDCRAVEGGCQQVFTVFGEMNIGYVVAVVA